MKKVKIKFVPFMLVGLFCIWVKSMACDITPAPAHYVPVPAQAVAPVAPVDPCDALLLAQIKADLKTRELLNEWAMTGSSSSINRLAALKTSEEWDRDLVSAGCKKKK